VFAGCNDGRSNCCDYKSLIMLEEDLDLGSGITYIVTGAGSESFFLNFSGKFMTKDTVFDFASVYMSYYILI
jgi:hypothetical protein